MKFDSGSGSVSVRVKAGVGTRVRAGEFGISSNICVAKAGLRFSYLLEFGFARPEPVVLYF